jgi:phosphoglycerol transferase
VAASVAALAIVVAAYDQTGGVEPDYAEVAATWRSDAAFVGRIEDTLDPGTPVFQLPIVAFPENGTLNGLLDYDQAIGYLHSDALQWSYGGVRGRDADWLQKLVGLPTPELLNEVVTAGFDGLTVDRRAYPDRATVLQAELESILGATAAESEDGHQLFFDLRPLAQEVRGQLGAGAEAARQVVVAPPLVRYGRGFYPAEYFLERVGAWARESSVLNVDNPTGEPRTYEVTGSFLSVEPGPWSVAVTGPGGEVARFEVTNGYSEHTFTIVAPPGRSELSVVTNAPADAGRDPRDLRIYVADLRTVTAPS